MLSLVARSSIRWGLGKLYPQVSRNLFASTIKTNQQFAHTDKMLEKKAVELIFGKKSYQNFNPEEKKLVDWYQDLMLKEDGGVILPNTKIDWEQRQVELLYARKK